VAELVQQGGRRHPRRRRAPLRGDKLRLPPGCVTSASSATPAICSCCAPRSTSSAPW
jgi:hypothetical protein